MELSRRILQTLRVSCGMFVLAMSSIVQQSSAADVVFKYDALGRLTRATYSNGSVVYYSLDAVGNRFSVIATTAPTPDTFSMNGGWYSDWVAATTGYISAMSLGSLSPVTTTDGKTVQAVYMNQYWESNYYEVVLVMAGPSGPPPQSWLNRMTISAGVDVQGSQATFYSTSTYSLWYWPLEYVPYLTGSQQVTLYH